MDDFEKERKIRFLQDASQLLADAEQCFLTLETQPEDAALLDQIFRLAHNLRGSSKAVGFDAMGAFTHEFESLLLKIENGEVQRSTSAVDLLLRCNHHLRQMVAALTGDLRAQNDSSGLTEEEAPSTEGDHDLDRMSETLSDKFAAGFSESVAIDPADIARLMALETTQRVPATPRPEDSYVQTVRTSAPPSSLIPVKAPVIDDSVRISVARLEKLLNFVGEMGILQSALREQSSALESPTLRKTVRQLGKISKEVQDLSMSLRMLPVKSIFQKMQRIVRDTAQATGKKVNLVISGEETELDKAVLEHLGDPLVHIIRNAVDHGIEPGEARRAAGKEEIGTVHLSAYHQGGRLVIEVKDNGGGINTEVLKRKAVEKGILHPAQTISEPEAVNLIFHAGFSTKAQVTEVSGRGVGMEVVRTNIEKLSGEIQIHTILGSGTTFKIFLPLALAIIDGMIIRAGQDRFVIPLAQVHESLRPTPNDIRFNTGFGEVLNLRGENLPLYRLSSLIGLKPTTTKNPLDGVAIVVRTTEKPFAVYVDDIIIGRTPIIIKSLGKEVSGITEFSGNTILEEGQPALILELPELIQKKTVLMTNPKKESAA